jgi:hypothetical protein
VDEIITGLSTAIPRIELNRPTELNAMTSQTRRQRSTQTKKESTNDALATNATSKAERSRTAAVGRLFVLELASGIQELPPARRMLEFSTTPSANGPREIVSPLA